MREKDIIMKKEDIEEIKQELHAFYPDRVVSGIGDLSKDLYYRIIKHAKRMECKNKEFIRQLGFYYYHKKGYTLPQVLQDKYPTKLIKDLQKKDDLLYQIVEKNAEDKNICYHEYLQALGFLTLKNEEPTLVDNQIQNRLLQLYPTREVMNFQAKDERFYQVIREEADRRGIDFKRYLNELGFQWNSKNNQVDSGTVRIIHRDFGVTLAEMARWLGVSRELIRQKLLKDYDTGPIWKNRVLYKDEEEKVLQMIHRWELDYEDEEIVIHMLINEKAVHLFIKTAEETKYIERVPESILTWIRKYRLDKYSRIDMEIKEKCMNTYYVGGGKIQILDESYREYFQKIARKRAMGMIEYANFLGFQYITTETYTDDEIKAILSEFLLPYTHTVCIPKESPIYNSMTVRAYRRKFQSLEDFVNYHGLQYEPFRTKQVTEQYQSYLRNNCMRDGVLYISNTGAMYNMIYYLAARHEMKEQTFLQSVGFNSVSIVSEEKVSLIQLENMIEKEGEKTMQQIMSFFPLKKEKEMIEIIQQSNLLEIVHGWVRMKKMNDM